MPRDDTHPLPARSDDTTGFDALIIGAGFSGLYQLLCCATGSGFGPRARSRRRRRRHLVLEPLPRRPLRFGKPLLLLHLLR